MYSIKCSVIDFQGCCLRRYLVIDAQEPFSEAHEGIADLAIHT